VLKSTTRELFVIDSIGDHDGSCALVDNAVIIVHVKYRFYVYDFLSNLIFVGKSTPPSIMLVGGRSSRSSNHWFTFKYRFFKHCFTNFN